MCCCGKPTINGQPGYSWDGKSFSTRPVDPPDLADGDELIYDEPGRCGGTDCHSHHFRLVKGKKGLAILVRHGGGDERIDFGSWRKVPSLDIPVDSRYWLMHMIYSAHSDAVDRAKLERDSHWRHAAAEKRIKTRKMRGGVKVWIEPKPEVVA